MTSLVSARANVPVSRSANVVSRRFVPRGHRHRKAISGISRHINYKIDRRRIVCATAGIWDAAEEYSPRLFDSVYYFRFILDRVQWKRSTRLGELLETISTHIFIPSARERDETRESKVSDTIRLIYRCLCCFVAFFSFFFFF